MNLNFIRMLTMRAKTEGVTESTSALHGLQKAHEGVAKSAQVSAQATEQSAKGQLSMAQSLDRLERRFNGALRSQQDYEKIVRQVNAAVAQNPALQARANDILARAAIHYNQAAASSGAYARAVQIANEQMQMMAGRSGGGGSIIAGFGPAGLIAAAGIGAATFAISKLIPMVNELADKGGKMVDFAETTGLTTRQIQALNKAGAEVGLTSEKIGQGFERFTVSLEELRSGSGQLFDIMGKINPALRDQLAAAKTTAAAWDILAKAIEKADLTQRNALARAAFGRTGIGMTRLAGASTEAGGLSGLEGNVSKFAPSQEDLRRWDELKDRIDYLKSTSSDVFTSLFADDLLNAQMRFFEGLLRIAEALKDIKQSEPEWFKMLKSLETLGPMQLLKGNIFGIFGNTGQGGDLAGQLGANDIRQPNVPQFSGGQATGNMGGPNLPSDYIAKLEKAQKIHEATLATIGAQTREQRLQAAEMSRAAELSDSKLSSEEKALEVARARAEAAARLNSQFEAQITSLAQQLELMEARRNGDEASVLSAQAYRNALMQGADQMQAMRIAALTMRIEMEKAADAAGRLAEQEMAAYKAGFGPTRTTFTTGSFQSERPATQFDASYGPGNVTQVSTLRLGILPNQGGKVSSFRIDEVATAAFRAQEQSAKLNQEVMRQLVNGVNPLSIEQQILSGKLGSGTYQNLFGGPTTARADADTIFQAILELEKRAKADPASTLARIRSGEIGAGASPEALLRAMDELTQAVNNNTNAINIGLSPFYTERGDRLFGYRGFATGGMAWGPETVRVAEREPEMIIPLSKLMGRAGNDNGRNINIHQEININAAGVDPDEVGESVYQATQRARASLLAKVS